MLKKIMLKKYLLTFIIAFLVLSVDLVSKYLVVFYFDEYEVKNIIPGFLNFVLVYNYGVSFSLFSEASFGQNIKMALLAMFALIPLSYFLYQAKSEEKLFVSGLALIFGGAIGNIHDRFRWGAVVDFIEIYVYSWSWPVFNVADIAVCIGVAFLIWATFFEKSNKK